MIPVCKPSDVCHWACTPVCRYGCASRPDLGWQTYVRKGCHGSDPPASTPEPRYGCTNPVTNVTGLARQNQTHLLSGSNFDLSIIVTFNSIMAADADAAAAARALAEARRDAKTTKLDMDVKAKLGMAMSQPTGFDGYMTQIFVSWLFSGALVLFWIWNLTSGCTWTLSHACVSHDMRMVTWKRQSWHDMTYDEYDMTWHDMTYMNTSWHDKHDEYDMTWHDMTWHNLKMHWHGTWFLMTWMT